MRFRLLLLAATFVLVVSARGEEPKTDSAKVTFEAVPPIIVKRCAKCHSNERPRGELDLSSYATLMQGGVSGKAVVAGNPDDSLLYTTIAHLEEPRMPPNSPKIPQSEIDTIRKWIIDGLVEKSAPAATTNTTVTLAVVPDGIGKPALLARPTPVTALAVSPTEPVVAVSGHRQVLVYELPTGKLVGGVPFPEGEVHALRFSRDGKVLLAAGGIGGQSGAVVGFQVGAWKRLFTVADLVDAVLAADISTDKTRIVFGGPGRLVKVVSVPDGKVVHTFRKSTDWVLSVGFSPDGLLVAAGDRFGGLFVWETKSGKEFHTLRGHTKGVTGIAWRADSDACVSCSDDGTVRIWDMHSGSQILKWQAHAEGALDVTMHNGGVIATAGRDGYVRVWDQKGQQLADLGPASDSVLKIAFSPDAKFVLSGDWSGGVRLWSVSGGTSTGLMLPVEPKPAPVAMVPVPVPNLPVSAVPGVVAPVPAPAVERLKAELARKRATLKAVEDAAEKLKDEAARNPKNPALAKAYLQLCEAALAMKTEVIETEIALAAAEASDKGQK